MDYPSLVRGLGVVLGFDLMFSDNGTCGVLFDNDEVLFEINDDRMFIMADLGSCEGREDAYPRLLKSSHLGLETGFACIGIDEVRGQFTLCRVLEGNLAYSDFEKILTVFIGAVRYWKNWLSQPKEQSVSTKDFQPPFTIGGIKI